jgi:hypothetical protein
MVLMHKVASTVGQPELSVQNINHPARRQMTATNLLLIGGGLKQPRPGARSQISGVIKQELRVTWQLPALRG